MVSSAASHRDFGEVGVLEHVGAHQRGWIWNSSAIIFSVLLCPLVPMELCSLHEFLLFPLNPRASLPMRGTFCLSSLALLRKRQHRSWLLRTQPFPNSGHDTLMDQQICVRNTVSRNSVQKQNRNECICNEQSWCSTKEHGNKAEGICKGDFSFCQKGAFRQKVCWHKLFSPKMVSVLYS